MDWDERIGRRLTLRDLSILLTTAEAGSMSRAASLLRVSQPAVSKSIAMIERAVGAQLVMRSSRGIEPTAHGLALLERSRSAFHELRQCVYAIEALSDPQSGELCIAASEVALAGIVATVINRLCARSSNIAFRFIPAYTLADQIRELEQGNVELVVGQWALPIAEGHLEAIELMQEKLVVVAGPRNRWVHRGEVELTELMDEPWTFPPLDSDSGVSMAQVFHASGLGLPQIAVVTSSMQLHRRLVLESGFLALFPDSVVRSAQSLKTLAVPLTNEPQSIGILTLRHRTPSPLAKLFIETAQDVARDDASITPSFT